MSRFAYVADRQRTGRQRPAETGVEQRQPPGQRSEQKCGRSPEPYEREGVDERIKELCVPTSLEKEKTRRTRDYIWLSWGVGGAIMLFVIFAIVWTCYERCKKKD